MPRNSGQEQCTGALHRRRDLDHSLQVELAEGALEAGLALGDVARYVVPVQPHVPPHIGQVQDLLQAGPRLRLLLDQGLHQLLQVTAVVRWDWWELATAGMQQHVIQTWAMVLWTGF